YALEAITTALEAKALEQIRAIDRLGGTVRAIEAGHQQRAIQESAYRTQQEMEKGDRVVVGVNRYQDEAKGAPLATHALDPNLEAAQAARVRTVRAKRPDAAARRALEAIEQAARGRDNLMPLLLDAVEAHATLGEIATHLRAAFGAYQPRERIA
ncbi:MAG TPA: methylmalonyl-CoA mutase family protein, partial [Candidatus Polarisedimenticolia bacterium]|nr:methylmalonyl-CoA mutase family protein [Candidatus Polarisedimenticolia bacterium]